ncbi:MAG: nucleotidyl transferase AbiEii/AbiGii toxin family protein [Verrucomicrobiota bacterium]
MGKPLQNPVHLGLSKLISFAKAAGMDDFLLIGGNVVIAMGVPRFTRDIDLVIPESDRRRWRELLEKRGFALINRTESFLQFEESSENEPRVDLMMVDGATWEKLNASAQTVEFAKDKTIGLPAVEHLIAMVCVPNRTISFEIL